MFSLDKIQGTGNDFLFFDARDSNSSDLLLKHLNVDSRAKAVLKLCHRHFGLGADGFIFIEPGTTTDLKWDFYNADGSTAEMCGNASRCMGLWAKKYNFKLPVSFESIAGAIKVYETDVNIFGVSLSRAEDINNNLTLKTSTGEQKVHYINTGVPHAVIEVKDFNLNAETQNLCAEIRNHCYFKEAGANATLYTALSDTKIKSVSYERGVEDFTLACGTGAAAAAYAWSHKNNKKVIEVEVPGGTLTVNLTDENPQLIGPAVYVGKMNI